MSIILIVAMIIVVFREQASRNVMSPDQQRIAQEQREINRKMAEIREQTFMRFNAD